MEDEQRVGYLQAVGHLQEPLPQSDVVAEGHMQFNDEDLTGPVEGRLNPSQLSSCCKPQNRDFTDACVFAVGYCENLLGESEGKCIVPLKDFILNC